MTVDEIANKKDTVQVGGITFLLAAFQRKNYVKFWNFVKTYPKTELIKYFHV